MPKKKPDVKLYEASNKDEALNFMWIGYKYFLSKNWYSTIITIVATGWCLFGPFIIGMKYISTDKVDIVPYESSYESTYPANIGTENLMLARYTAPQDATRIIVDGKVFKDYYDPDYVIYLIKGTTDLFVYNRKAPNDPLRVSAPFLTKETFRKYSK